MFITVTVCMLLCIISILIPHRNGSLQKRYKRNVVAIYRTNNDNGAIVNTSLGGPHHPQEAKSLPAIF